MVRKEINILLDLDQTLIAALSPEELDLKKDKKKMSMFKHVDMDGYYTVFERPHLQKFLDYLFNNYNVSIWTAASKDYALFIIDKYILKNNPKRKLDFIFFSYHCKWSSKHKNGTKDLSMLWDIYKIAGYNKNNTIIIDDYDEVKDTQPSNCILIKGFEFKDQNSENDTFLLELISKLKSIKRKLSHSKELDKIID